MKKIAMIVTAVLALAVMIGGITMLVLDLQQQVEKAEAATAAVSAERDTAVEDRDRAQGQVAEAEAEVIDLTNEVTDLESTVEQCSVMPTIANHLFNANGHLLDAVESSLSGGLFGGIPSSSDIDSATGSITKATRLLDENQSRDGELWKVCGESGGLTA